MNKTDVAYDANSQARITNEEWFEISQALEIHHAVFYKIWQMGKPNFTETVGGRPLDTAAVEFDKEGEFTWFHFNPHFWKRISFKKKLFIICHEALHIILNHGARIRDIGINHSAGNSALDVVVNHSLVNNFNFIRNEIDDWSDYCWIETVFKDRNPLPPQNETFEYYYNLFKKVYGDGYMGSSEEDGTKTVDDHSMLGEDWGKLIDELNKSLSEDEKDSLKSIVEKHFEKEKNENEKKAGEGTGGQWVFANIGKVKKKAKWETVIRRWSKKYLKFKEKDEEQWARLNRRLTLLPKDMFLPSEMEIDDSDKEKTRIDVWFFLDTSGSCWNLKDRFFAAASSLPIERFNVRLFCFDTEVKETTLESKKIYGGGGTSFRILEAEIQKAIKNGEKYPEAVFVITDGYGDNIAPEKPSNWYWFITAGGSRNCIKKECNFYNLNDFE